MKGPGIRIDLDVRRTWRCPRCARVVKASGNVVSQRCTCSKETAVWMQLEDQPRSRRFPRPNVIRIPEVFTEPEAAPELAGAGSAGALPESARGPELEARTPESAERAGEAASRPAMGDSQPQDPQAGSPQRDDAGRRPRRKKNRRDRAPEGAIASAGLRDLHQPVDAGAPAAPPAPPATESPHATPDSDTFGEGLVEAE